MHMKSYSFISPSLSGILSDDYLYFEGTTRPQKLLMFNDEKKLTEEMTCDLERYFNDLYNLFLRKLTTFASGNSGSDEEVLKLQALLHELIKVRKIIEKASGTDIMEG